MLSSISEFQKKIWNKWNIPFVILFSLFLQIFLIVSAPSRKRTRGFFGFFVWLAYLLADWAAGYCIGLISNNQEQKSTLSPDDSLMAFWGPFLLLHLGGPDTISAFALEDNELWLRHLLALIFQAVTAAYVFLLTIPHNTLWLPTILMFVAGLIKYLERTHALYVAAINNFRKSLLPVPDAGPNYAKLMEEYSSRDKAGLPAKIIMISELRHQKSKEAPKSNPEQNGKPDPNNITDVELVQLVQKAFFFFHKFQGLIVDMIYSFKDRLDSHEYFTTIGAVKALVVIEIELNFMYEVFYTKASVIRQYRFWFWGKFVSLISIIATTVLFIKEERHGGFNTLDVKVTYTLLSGALVLDVVALFMRFFTDFTVTLSHESLIDSYSAASCKNYQVRVFKYLNKRLLAWYLRLRKPTWSKINEDPYKECEKLSTKFLFRRWSGSIPAFNLLKYSLDESIPRVPMLKYKPDESMQRDADNREGSNDPTGNVPSGTSGKTGKINRLNYIGQLIQRACFRIVVSVQDFFYRRDKRSRFKDLLDQMRYEYKNPFLKELWAYIFDELKGKSSEAHDIEAIQNICSARGNRVIHTMLERLKADVDSIKVAEQLESLKPFVDPDEVVFDESLLLWHIATALCDTQDAQVEVKEHMREISKILSDYMLYLLIMQPNMMSAIAGIGQKRFQDTCEEAKRFFKKRISAKGDRKDMLNKACQLLIELPTEQKPSAVKGDRSKSLFV